MLISWSSLTMILIFLFYKCMRDIYKIIISGVVTLSLNIIMRSTYWSDTNIRVKIVVLLMLSRTNKCRYITLLIGSPIKNMNQKSTYSFLIP